MTKQFIKALVIILCAMPPLWMSASTPESTNPEGVIKGKVFDGKSNAPVEYATVAIYKTDDNSVVTGTISDEHGEFKIKGIDPGSFYIVVSFLGYEDKRYDNVLVEKSRGVLDLGNIVLGSSSKSIDEVEVVAERQSVEFKIDKKVVSVGKQMTSASLSAVEVLQNVPSIRVDIEGNVSLRGSTGFTVLIDGGGTRCCPSEFECGVLPGPWRIGWGRWRHAPWGLRFGLL